MDDILKHERNEDYVFINLLDETPVLSPMEKVRSVYPNAIHVKRQAAMNYTISAETIEKQQVELTPLAKFEMLFKEVKGSELTNKPKRKAHEGLEEILLDEPEAGSEVRNKATN